MNKSYEAEGTIKIFERHIKAGEESAKYLALTLRMFTRILRKGVISETHMINHFIEKHFTAIKAIEGANLPIDGNSALIKTSKTLCCSRSATLALTKESSQIVSLSSPVESSTYTCRSSKSCNLLISASISRSLSALSGQSQLASAISQTLTHQCFWSS